jgi:predicted dehydrogenase
MVYTQLQEEPVPDGLDWEAFCGPTPTRPHNRRLWVKDEFRVDGVLWRGWDLWFDYSGHLATNWGAHSVDIVQLALGKVNTGPVEVWPITDKYKGETRFCPVGMRYANGVELRFDISLKDRNRWEFYGDRGMLSMHRNNFFTDPPDLIEDPPDPKLADKWKGAGSVARPHIENWIECIRTRSEPAAPVEAGHRAVTICHLVGIARRSGCRLRWDPEREIFEGNDDANRLLQRPRRKGWELPII